MSVPDHVDPSVVNADPNRTTGTGPGSSVTAVPPTATQRYTLGDEIARGGMGVVYRATDTALGREVAVKVLQERYAADSGTARRFADEARITGQLQHPGIPPVHDLGTLPDGRPFLAMKLIKGSTLEELLKQRTDPAADRGRFVAVFEQVCQALAYAHAHGVIHRDLKPANVMVGRLRRGAGDGLGPGQGARRGSAGHSGRPRRTTTRRGRRWSACATATGRSRRPGSVLGTPAFMPPEQAVGADRQGRRAQRRVRAGGGAGGHPDRQAAVRRRDRPRRSRVQAVAGKLDDCFARLDACGAEPELVALCKRCLALEPADRPPDAGAVAAGGGGLAGGGRRAGTAGGAGPGAG